MRFIKYVFVLCLIASQSFANNINAEFSTDQPVRVFADSHGDYETLRALLIKSNIIDSSDNWIANQSHVVSTGDYLDRGAESRKILDLIMSLQEQAIKAGGMFHTLLGNHEVMNLIGDLRYVSDGEFQAFAKDETSKHREQMYQSYLAWKKLVNSQEAKTTFDKQYPKGFFALRKAFSLEGQYGKWLVQQPIVIKINDNLYTHGGLSHHHLSQSLPELSHQLSQDLQRYLGHWQVLEKQFEFFPGINDSEAIKLAKSVPKSDSNYKEAFSFSHLSTSHLFAHEGPIWYRGNSHCHSLTEQDHLQTTLHHFKAKRLVVGHTVTPTHRVTSRFDKQLYMIDTGMNKAAYQGYGSMLTFDNNDVSVTYTDNSTIGIVDGWAIYSPYPSNWTAADMEKALTKGTISSVTPHKTKPDLSILAMAYQGSKFNAVFDTKDEKPDLATRRWRQKDDQAYRYQAKLAAYEVSNALGLEIVPATVIRDIEGKTGSLQYQLPNEITQVNLENNQISYQGYCDIQEQFQLMSYLDVVILNVHRNSAGMLYDPQVWQLWLTDHGNAFSTGSLNRKRIRGIKQTLSSEIQSHLNQLDQDELKKKLAPLLNEKQIDAMLKRLDGLN